LSQCDEVTGTSDYVIYSSFWSIFEKVAVTKLKVVALSVI